MPQKWKIRGTLAIVFLYLAVLVLIFMLLHPMQDSGSQSIALLIFGYILFFLGIIIVVIPIFIPRYQVYPGRLVVLSLLFYITAFNILFKNISGSVDTPVFIAFYIGLISIAFGSRLYSRVIKEVSTEKARIDTEIKLAQKIQTDLLPTIDIEEDRYQAYGRTMNAQEVGGDFFDVVLLDNRRIAFCVGDVSGHNIAAGLIMGIVKSAFRTELRYNNNLSSITESLNKTVIEQRSRGMFVSFAAGIVNFEHREVEFINAGHPPVIHVSDGKADTVHLEGAALGLSERLLFTGIKHTLSPGDALICYSDGIIEARNKRGEEFSMRRFIQVVSNTSIDASANELYTIVYSKIEEFANQAKRIDDITLLIVKLNF